MSAKNETENKKTKNSKRGVGRPPSKMIDPQNAEKGCTFSDICEAQGMRWVATKKEWTGGNCTPLTVRHHLPTALSKGLDYYKHRSRYFITGETVAPDSKKGLGRKQFVFKLRAGVEPIYSIKTDEAKPAREVAKTLKTAAASSVTVPVLDVPAQTAPAETPIQALEAKLEKIDAETAAIEAPATSTLPVVSLEPAENPLPARDSKLADVPVTA